MDNSIGLRHQRRPVLDDNAAFDTMAIVTARAMQLWQAYDAKWERGFFRKTGALWMFGADASFGTASAAALKAQGLPIER